MGAETRVGWLAGEGKGAEGRSRLGRSGCGAHHPAHRAERPRDPGGVAAFVSAHSKNPCITPSMEFSSREGVVRGRRVQQLAFA